MQTRSIAARFLAHARIRIYRIPTSLIYVHRGLSDEPGVLRELSLPMIRDSESSSLRDDDDFPRESQSISVTVS